MFVPPDYRNLGFYITGPGSDKPFAALMTNVIPDLAFWGSTNGKADYWTYIQEAIWSMSSDDEDQQSYLKSSSLVSP